MKAVADCFVSPLFRAWSVWQRYKQLFGVEEEEGRPAIELSPLLSKTGRGFSISVADVGVAEHRGVQLAGGLPPTMIND